jgi:hypothetical protein
VESITGVWINPELRIGAYAYRDSPFFKMISGLKTDTLPFLRFINLERYAGWNGDTAAWSAIAFSHSAWYSKRLMLDFAILFI